ncbi:MAG: hypothetical protein CMF23_11735 [Ignavibacteriae bacterium]|nr:hypothetical protein [Ignavibacteriota bacterium]
MRVFTNLLALVLILFFSIQLSAGTTGKIAGTVKDKDTGEGLPLANVFINGTDLGAATDFEGNFTILNVPPGVYSVTASVVGYQKITITDVRVNVDFTTRLEFELPSGSVELEAIVVQGERNPLIRQDLTNPTVAITSETIQELPVDQISDVIRLQAGVTVGDDGDIHIRGGYGNEIAYSLNGVSLNDPYGNRRSVGLATNAVQEVSVSSGTFSAQYGNALSGVVNYVTKEGGEKYTFSLRGYAGDYVTSRTDLYDNIDDIDPLNRGRMEATFGGPIPFTGNDVRIFFSGVFENSKGRLYGRRLYNPTDSYLSREQFREGDSRRGSSTDPYFFNPYSSDTTGLPTGDGSWVAMNPNRSWNMQGNISWKISPTFKLKYEAVYDQAESKSYSFAYKFNPDGVGTDYSTGLIQSFDITHTVSQNMFYTLKASYGVNKGKYYLYENINDPGYLPNLYSLGVANTGFYSGGTSNYRSFRETKTTTVKGDLVAQLFGNHELKFGFETRFHDLSFEGYSVEIGKLNSDGTFGNLTPTDMLYDSTLTLIRRKPTSPSLLTEYRKFPVDMAVYMQDKIELASTLILNVGLRYEYFDPKADYNPNLTQDLKDLQAGYINRSNIPAEVKHQVSPRISVSYPITDRGIIRFSYGHFYQNGSLSSLYRNNNFYVANFGDTPSFGNPDVNMQRSVQYEIGLQQQLAEDLKFDLTGFYKDVRDYIFSQTVFTSTGREFNVLTNLAYSNVRGITLSVLKRRAPGSLFYATLDYTFQIAEGNRTYPEDELFFSEQSGKQSETFLVPLGFDRQHVLNLTTGLMQPNDWTLGLITNIQTGTPYTPILPSQLSPISFEQNSDRQPMQWNVDLKFEKYFTIDPIDFSIFVQVNNLFDTENERAVYASTGRSLTSLDPAINPNQFNDIRNRIEGGQPGLFGIEEIDKYYSKRPERVSPPREIRVGFSVLFN